MVLQYLFLLSLYLLTCSTTKTMYKASKGDYLFIYHTEWRNAYMEPFNQSIYVHSEPNLVDTNKSMCYLYEHLGGVRKQGEDEKLQSLMNSGWTIKCAECKWQNSFCLNLWWHHHHQGRNYKDCTVVRK